MFLNLNKSDCENEDIECKTNHIRKVLMNQKISMLSLYFIIFFIITFSVKELYEVVKLDYEPDPLYISVPEDQPEWVTCQNRTFHFKRYVKNDKFIQVSVEPRLVDLKTGVIYVLPGKTYEGPEQDNIVSYRTTIPEYFPNGDYEYIPTLTYKVNQRKIITKVSPSVKVHLNCDPEKPKSEK